MTRPRVALQPAANPVARNQFAWTVAREVDFRPYAAALGPHLAPLLKAFPHGDARIGGVSGKPGSRAAGEVQRLRQGDLVLFVRDGRAVAGGTVAHRWSSATLARRLWGAPPSGHSWLGMYALDRFTELEIPAADVNLAAGFQPGYTSPGLRVLDDVRSGGILDQFADDLAPLTNPRPNPRARRRPVVNRVTSAVP